MRLISRGAVVLLAALTLLGTASTVAEAQVVAGSPAPAARQPLLPRAGHGAAVVAALGTRLPEAATINQMSAVRLRAILEGDPTAWIGADGHLFYVESAASLADVAAGFTTAQSVGTTTYPASQAFALHSLPTSTHKIYLDFNGDTVSGTWWNANLGMPSRYYTGFTLDGDPSTFNAAELSYIQQVWRIVAEKYAAFDVDVTTEDPGASGYDRSGSSDQTYGDHVIITDDSGAVTSACGGGCSGIAMVGTFDDYSRTDSYYEPAWVFSSKTWGSPGLTAHTVAHEVGHTLGLSHDGITGGTSYYSGQGNWFPIMGTGVNGVGQFSKGEYSGANNTEDDLAVIAANGAPLRTDDYGNTPGTATALGSATSYAVDGVISTRADQDVVAISHDCTGNIAANATGIGEGTSLDISLTVLGPDGSPIATADPASGQDTSAWPALPTGMEAGLSVPAAPGTYYLRVDGVGSGDPATTGYSDYASIGQYHLAIAQCGGSIPPPPVAPTPIPVTVTAPTATAPGAPGIRLASSGRRGGRVTATARWATPTNLGGSAVAGYRVQAILLSSSGRLLRVVASRTFSASAHAASLRLTRGHYRFRVLAFNGVGTSPVSALSRTVTAR